MTPAEALDANFAELLAWYASWPGAEFVRDDDVWLCHSGVPFRAVNAACRLDLRDVRRVDEVNAFFNQRGMPWRWLVGASSRPSNLDRALEASGLVCVSDNPGMALELEPLAAQPVDKSGLTIERVADEAGLRAWRAVQVSGLGLDPLRDDAWWTAHRRPGFANDLPLVNWVGFVDGEPVAAAALFDGAGVAGIYNVVTVPHARGRGFGRAVTAEAIADGVRRGRALAVLGSSDMGLPVYRRLGFREISRLRSYAPG